MCYVVCGVDRRRRNPLARLRLTRSMTDTLLSTGIDRCRRAGAAVTRSETAAEPPAVARPASGAAATDALQRDGKSPTAGGDDARPTTPEALLTAGSTVAIEPLPEVDPTTVLSRLWNNHTNDRATLFVVPSHDAVAAVGELLSPPVGAVETDDGRRFHTGPDRVPLDEGGYAAVPTGDPLVWRESASVSDDPSLTLSISEAGSESPAAEAPAASDTTWLELRAGETVLARLDGVDALACPPRARFPYAYHRDGDKQIRVLDFAGRPVQRYTGIAAMRRGGFRPVPAPLVPEHMFDGSTTGWWAVLPATE
jgi:hypothetical protein